MRDLSSLLRLLDFKRRPQSVVFSLSTVLLFSAVAFATESSIDDLIKAKQYAKALPILDAKLSKEPLSQPDLINKARCLEGLNQWKEVSGTLMMVGIQKNLTGQNLYDYCVLSIESDRHSHEYAAAKQVCETLIGIDPEHADKWRTLKTEFSRLAQKSKAR